MPGVIDSEPDEKESPDEGGEVREADMLDFVCCRSTPEQNLRIAAALQQEGSFARDWLERSRAALADPFNVDQQWITTIGEKEDGEAKEEDGEAEPA